MLSPECRDTPNGSISGNQQNKGNWEIKPQGTTRDKSKTLPKPKPTGKK